MPSKHRRTLAHTEAMETSSSLIETKRVNKSKDHLEITWGQLLLLLSQQHHELEECQSIPSLPAATALAPPILHYINTKPFF